MASHSRKRTQLTFALAIVLLVLLAIIAWIELGSKPDGLQATQRIDNIVITRKGHDDITLVRDDSTWQMTTPYALRANTQRIEPLLGLGQAPFDGYSKSEVDLPATGLTQPGASIAFDERTFVLGETDASGERRYSMVDGAVGFVPAWVWSLVHGGVTAFADLTVFDQLPDKLYLADGIDVRELDNKTLWEALQADKIIAWPDNPEPDSQTSIDGPRVFLLRTTGDENTGEVLATIVRTSDYAAISTKPDFAFAISNARLNTLLNL